jgi:hypothetical protein
VLAEAVTFIIRKTVVEILKRGWRDKFKDRDARERFWMMKYALPKNQGPRRLREEISGKLVSIGKKICPSER